MKQLFFLFFLIGFATSVTAQKIPPIEEPVPVSQPELEKITTASPADTGDCDEIKIQIHTYADSTRMVWINFPENLLGEEIDWEAKIDNATLIDQKDYRVGPASLGYILPAIPAGTTEIIFYLGFLGYECPAQEIKISAQK